MENIVLMEVSERIATLTLNRPDKRNALNPSLVNSLQQHFEELANRQDVKVIILKANGTVFSAGADLAYLQQIADNSYEENLEDSKSLGNLFYTIFTSPKLVLTQVEGHAIAGGCGLTTVCDMVFSVPEAKFGYTEVKLGFAPAIVSCFLAPKVGDMLARKLLLTGELFSAHQALQYNLITFVTEREKINLTVRDFALDFCRSTSANSIAETKKLINKNGFAELEKQLASAVVKNAKIRESEDFKKGVASFLNKEELKW